MIGRCPKESIDMLIGVLSIYAFIQLTKKREGVFFLYAIREKGEKIKSRHGETEKYYMYHSPDFNCGSL